MKTKEIVMTVLTAIFGIASTYTLSIYAKQGAVIGASLICLIGGLFFGNYAGVNNSGAFAGMSSSVIMPSIEYTLPAGLIVGVLWIVLIKNFLGYGGKQGTIGFISAITSSLILHVIPPSHYFSPSAYSAVDATFILLIVIASTIGAVGTIILREKVVQRAFKQNDAIIGAALIGLLAGFLIRVIPVNPVLSSTLPAVVAAGSYAGMSSRTILKKGSDFLVVGVVTGMIYIVLLPFFVGCGGKLGTSAFLSVNLWKMLKRK